MNRLLYNNSFWYRATRHIVFFIGTVLAFSWILYSYQNGSFYGTVRETSVNALFFFGYAYITIFLLIPEYLIKRKLILFMVLFVLIGVALSALKLVVSETIFYASISPENIQKEGLMNLRYMVVNTKDMSFIVALFCIAKYVKDYLYSEVMRKKLELQTKVAKGKLLQAQFDPHFMFNTINNLYALALLNPQKTREVVKRMKTVLNYIIEESQRDYVLLGNEIKLVENYIDLEQLRYGKRLKVEMDTEGVDDATKIPPMILFILVENCFRHGSSLDAGIPWIKIQVKTMGNKIEIGTENSKPKLSEEIKKIAFKEGQGLKNLRKRLELLYSRDGYKLNFKNEENVFFAKLELKKQFELVQQKYR